MNKLFLIGNLTRDPELTETASGVSVCRFSMAVNRAYANGDGERKTDFFYCTAWRGLAENISRYCKKGNKVAVEGSIQIRTYEGNDGVKRTAVDVIVQECEFLTSPNRDREDDFYDDSPRSTGLRSQSTSQRRKPVLQAFDDDGDIPF